MFGLLRRFLKRAPANPLAAELSKLSLEEAQELKKILQSECQTAGTGNFLQIYVSVAGSAVVPVAAELSKQTGRDELHIRSELVSGPVFLREENDEPTMRYLVERFEALGAKILATNV